MRPKNKVQLITYPDSLGGDLKALDTVLERHFKGLFQGGVHILPPFPSTGDRGFSPVSYFEIEPAFGSWTDVQKLGGKYDLMLDLMVNHVSSGSEFFKDYLAKGSESEYADMFIDIRKFWPDGNPPAQDLEKIFLRRPLPFSNFEVGPAKEKRSLWTTFGKGDPSNQIDIDIHSKTTRAFYARVFEFFAENGIRFVRLDAVGYVTKQPGTSCFFVKPGIFEFLDEIKAIADEKGIGLLPEVHATWDTQRELSEHGFLIYDFILPYLILEAILQKDARKLNKYLRERPAGQVTMLDCHDGIPVKPDLDGIYDKDEVRAVVNTCIERGANMSKIMSPAHKDPDGFDIHQIRGTYYSMLNEDDEAYFAARAIQLFTPGIPQIYYVGLLAGRNDFDSVEKTGEGREINRHSYTVDEIEREVQRPLVKRLLGLIEFRNTYDAFDGEYSFEQGSDKEIKITWSKDRLKASLTVDLVKISTRITYFEEQTGDWKELK